MKFDPIYYEQFLIDYLDGQVSDELRAEIEQFLDAHPDIAHEFRNLQQAALLPDPPLQSIPDFSFLMQKELPLEEVHAIQLSAFIDHELSKSDEAWVQEQIHRNPEWKTHFHELQKTRLIPDKDIVFSNKSSLKKESRILPLYAQNWIRYAASLLIVSGALTWFLWSSKHAMQSSDVALHPSEKSLPNEKSQASLSNSSKIISTKPKYETKAANHIVLNASSQTLLQKDTLKLGVKSEEHPGIQSDLAQVSHFQDLPDLTWNITSETTQLIVSKNALDENNIQGSNRSLIDLLDERITREALQSTSITSVQAPSQPIPGKIGLAALTMFNRVTGSDVKLQHTIDSTGVARFSGFKSIALFARVP